jgi:hypothetical protein
MPEPAVAGTSQTIVASRSKLFVLAAPEHIDGFENAAACGDAPRTAENNNVMNT